MAELAQDHYQKLVDQWSAMGLKDLALEFRRLQDKHAEEKAIAAKTYAEFEILRRQIIPQVMEDMGLETAKVDGVGRIQIGHQLSAKQLNKEALMDWLRDAGHESLVAETVNSSTLSSFIREQIANGEEIPGEDIIEVSAYDVASVVKA